jgi:hypothetical protein
MTSQTKYIVVETAEQNGGVVPKLSRQNGFRCILLQFSGFAPLPPLTALSTCRGQYIMGKKIGPP